MTNGIYGEKELAEFKEALELINDLQTAMAAGHKKRTMKKRLLVSSRDVP